MPYRSPVADILFSLSAVADLPDLIGRGLMGDLDWEFVSSIVAEAGRFATEEIAPLNRAADVVGARYENGGVTTPPGSPTPTAVRRRRLERSPRRPNSAARACPSSSTSPDRDLQAPSWASDFARS